MGGALIVAIVQTGHFLADFYFQSGRMAKRKRNSSFALLAHCVIYAIVMAVFCGGGLICLGAISVESSIVVWAVISVSHGVIDAVKVQIEKRGANQFALFSIDQILHLAIAIASPTIAIYIAGGDCYSGNYMDPVITARIIAAFSTLVFIWKPCMVFIAMLLEQIEKDPDVSIVEMDCVEGNSDGHKVLLTLTFRKTTLMLIFLMKSQTQEEVIKVFSFLEDELGTELFSKLFEIILTDGGSEFADRTGLETSNDGKTKRTTIYYCDPYSFWQKGCCEKNHEYIRYVRKKGSSFDDLNQEKVTLLANHINSTKRDSLNMHCPFELSQLLLDEQLLSVMGYKLIAPDDVMLTPELLK